MLFVCVEREGGREDVGRKGRGTGEGSVGNVTQEEDGGRFGVLSFGV